MFIWLGLRSLLAERETLRVEREEEEGVEKGGG